VLYYGGRLVLDGEMSPGDLTAFVLCVDSRLHAPRVTRARRYTLTVGFAFGGLTGLFGTWRPAGSCGCMTLRAARPQASS
jgi:hypothetical protein